MSSTVKTSLYSLPSSPQPLIASTKRLRLFVTGGTGFIGSHFLNQALAAGHEVLALRRSPTSQPRIPILAPNQEPGTTNQERQHPDDVGDHEPRTKNQERPHPPALRWIDGPMPDVAAEDLAGCDVLVHLAAHTPNVPYDTLENCLQWNLIVPLGLFRRAHEAGISRFVVAGSCFEYGRAGERYEFIPPDAPLEPTQTYPASKAAASVAFYQLAVELNLTLSIHRIFQVFGEGEAEARLWPSLRRAALAGQDLEMTPAEQIRDFIPVEDVAARLLAACLRTDVRSGFPVIENLGTGHPQSLREFAETWWKHWNATGKLKFAAKPYREGEVMRFVPELKRKPN